MNPYAHFRSEITYEEYLQSRVISTPLRLYDCAPISDGAAALVLTAHPTDVRIAGVGQGTDTQGVRFRDSFTAFRSTQLAAKKAYDMAGLNPRDIDFAELHDAFTPFEIIATEDLGFFEPGKGGRAVEKGMTSLTGELPINPSGGLKARGHPVGASGRRRGDPRAELRSGDSRTRAAANVRYPLPVRHAAEECIRCCALM